MADIYENRTNPAHDEEVKSYYEEIIALALLFLAGEVTRAQYTALHIELTEQNIVNGVIMAGGALSAPNVLSMLKEQQQITQESTRNLANDLDNGRYSPTDDRTEAEAETMLGNRLALWTFTLGSAYVVGQLNKPPQRVIIDDTVQMIEPVYRWILGPTEHCSDCFRFSDFAPMTAQEWQRYPSPQSPDLECGGWNCQCNLEEVAIEAII